MRNIFDHYWQVASDDRYWSSRAGGYVNELPNLVYHSLEEASIALSMPIEELAVGVTIVTPVSSEQELAELLASLGLRGPFVTAGDIIAERTRRLALGFEFDFGDVREVHHIGTTDEDMKGWREVTDSATAAIALGNGALPLTVILTDTGPAQVTALEWMSIVNTARLARQPLWAASFALQAMSPIPADYTNDSYWS